MSPIMQFEKENKDVCFRIVYTLLTSELKKKNKLEDINVFVIYIFTYKFYTISWRSCGI